MPSYVSKLFSLLAIWLCSQLVIANTSPPATAEFETIAAHPVWLKLMHYETNTSSRTSLKSAIHSPSFFNATNGSTDPLAELNATIKAFYEPAYEQPDKHPQCLFRGRFLWLKKQLNLSAYGNLPAVECKAFNAWSLNGSTESISIIYATGYLNNPASYYGHTLLKLNAKSAHTSSKLLDVSVNYGAIVPNNENPAVYIYKGLTGGYEAGFTHIEYYYHTHNYGENELRDLWEYQLNLSKDEVDLVLAHSWEVLGEKYTYYFLNKNCAYRMAELFEVVDDLHLTTGREPWFLPQTTIQQLTQINRGGKPLISRIEYHPSRQSRLYEKYQVLSSHQRKQIKLIVKNIDLLDSKHFIKDPLSSQHLILDTLLDYYQAFDTEANKALYNTVLSYRYRLAPGVPNINTTQPSAPHLGRKPSRTQLSGLQNSALGTGISLSLRPAYYDELDSNTSHVKYAALTMASVELMAINDQLKLRNLDVIEIVSVNTKATGLPGDKQWSWKLKGGIETQNLACEKNCLIAHANADRGYSFSPSTDLLLTGYLGGGAQDNRNGSGNLYLRASGTVVWSLSQRLRAQLEMERREYISGMQKHNNKLSLTGRYQLSKNTDMRFSYAKDQAEEFSLSLGLYW